MQQIINFLIKHRNLLLFLVLFGIAFFFTIQSHDYHRNAFISSSNSISGGILSTRDDITGYFDLKSENQRLQEENALLRMRLSKAADTLFGQPIDTLINDAPYVITPARVVKNSFSKRNNYLTLDIGKKQEIEEDQGVYNSNGVVGVIDETGDRFSRVVSILNTQLSISASIKNTSTIGSLKWDGEDPYIVNLEDVPRLARVQKGDSVVTGNLSTIFPPGILIGTIKSAELLGNTGRYDIKVRLSNDMTDLGHAYVVRKRDREAIQVMDTLGLNE